VLSTSLWSSRQMDFCDALVLAHPGCLLPGAASSSAGRFAVVQAWQMRLIHVHDEPKLDPNVSQVELTVVQHYWNGVRCSAGPSSLGTLGIIYEAVPSQRPPKAWAPLR